MKQLKKLKLEPDFQAESVVNEEEAKQILGGFADIDDIYANCAGGVSGGCVPGCKPGCQPGHK